MMIPDATITNAVYRVNLGLKRIIYATSPSHNTPKKAKRSMTDVFIFC